MTDDDAIRSHSHSRAPVTDSEIEALAAEAEAGYDVDRLIARRRKRARHCYDAEGGELPHPAP